MDELTAKQLCANAIGKYIIMYLDSLAEGEIAALAESQALSLTAHRRHCERLA